MTMTFDEFTSSLALSTAPPELTKELEAMWHDGKGNWEHAHNIAQENNSSSYCLIHAYLHRKEGDKGNASYWYNRAGRKMPAMPLNEEWKQLVKEFLQN